MAKYRPVDVRVWTDRKFVSLSTNGRLLWIFLMTTPSTLPIPGVVVGGEEALAEQLGWTSKLLRTVFAELFAKQLSVRVDGRLIWLPNAIRYQPAKNPKMVIGWSRTWDDVPECGLKHEIWLALKLALAQWSELFGQLFAEPLVKQAIKLFPQDQEQKQDQEQDQEQDIRTKKHLLPDGWFPAKSEANALAETEAVNRGVSIPQELLRLADWARGKAEKKADWNATWRNWTRNAKGTGRAPASRAQTALDAQLERVRMLEAEEAAGGTT